MLSLERWVELLAPALVTLIAAVPVQWGAHRLADRRDRKKEFLADIVQAIKEVDEIVDAATALWSKSDVALPDHESLQRRTRRLGRRLESMCGVNAWFDVDKEWISLRSLMTKDTEDVAVELREAHISEIQRGAEDLIATMDNLSRRHRR